nr:PEP-CTERM sorting domain-containing protein [uncultured Desulfobacter sp.]
MLNNKSKSKCGLIITCMALCLLLGMNNVSAETISLSSLLDTTIWDDEGNWNWKPGDDLSITANATGIDVGLSGEGLFDSYLKFEIVAEYTKETGYSGDFSITDFDDQDTVYLKATFDSLALKYIYGFSLLFETGDVSSASGQLMETTLSDMTVSLTNGIAVSWDTSSFFLGSISLEKNDPIANPEPGTFFLLGFGMLGLAHISRKKCEIA